jgi:hypothetical protein
VLDRNQRLADHGSWDYAWLLACWLRGGLSASPAANLVSNLGFGAGATNTGMPSRFARMAAREMMFPLTHPAQVVEDASEDQRLEHDAFSGTFDRLLSALHDRICASST